MNNASLPSSTSGTTQSAAGSSNDPTSSITVSDMTAALPALVLMALNREHQGCRGWLSTAKQETLIDGLQAAFQQIGSHHMAIAVGRVCNFMLGTAGAPSTGKGSPAVSAERLDYVFAM